MWIGDELFRATRRPRPYDGLYGVTRYEPDRCFEGYTLFSPAWGHLVFLIDMRGLVVQTWSAKRSNLSRLLPDGRLLTHAVGECLLILRADGSTDWRWQTPAGLERTTHHDFQLVGDAIWTLAKARHPVVRGFYEPAVAPDFMLGDLLLEVGLDGQLRRRIALAEHIESLLELTGRRLPIRYRMQRAHGPIEAYGPPDWAHANSLQVLPSTALGQKDSRFRAGNLLISLRNLDIVLVLDPDAEAVVWAWGPEILDAQHHASLLPDGRLRIFDNGSWRGHSILRELDPISGTLASAYDDPENFYSPKRGSHQLLPNGNTLICESDTGRLFEITAAGEIVWQYVSPFLGQGPRHMGRRIYRATRLSPAEIEPLLAARAEQISGHRRRDGQKVESFAELLALYQEGWS